MHRAGARAAPDGSARAAHRDAAAPLASEHGGSVTERVATASFATYTVALYVDTGFTGRPPVLLQLCGRVRRVSLSVRVRPPSSHFGESSLFIFSETDSPQRAIERVSPGAARSTVLCYSKCDPLKYWARARALLPPEPRRVTCRAVIFLRGIRCLFNYSRVRL